ncbi:MAG: hypothetical protein MZV63_45440 [Marinilabiliales bacterium]|nr:hypothetical protein [Marinilabiliales bacterium]
MQISLKRSQTNTHPCTIGFEAPDNITGKIFYQKFRSEEEWVSVPMNHDGSRLAGELPSQPAAGKLEYYIILTPPSGSEITISKDEPGSDTVQGQCTGSGDDTSYSHHVFCHADV